MAYKHTLALIGAASPTGTLLASRLADRYRLLLMDSDLSLLAALQETIRLQHPRADMEVLNCCKDASWEADIVVISVADDQLETIADRIREVTTCKTVIQFTTDAACTSTLQQRLPHANVITVVLSGNDTNPTAVVYGTHPEALQTTASLLIILGCTPQYAD
jgi:ketopantoate reductase